MVEFTGEIHPFAAVWPMRSEDELRDLAEDIRTIGLRDSIVLDAEGRLLDGRNRLAACGIAGVEPTFRVHDGDPLALVLSAENQRRHQSTGQRAMGTAILLQRAGLRRNGRWQRGSIPEAVSQEVGLSAWLEAMRRAGVVLDHAPEMAPLVVSDDSKLDAAYKVADEARKHAERVAELPDDLAALVNADAITIDDALDRVRDAERLAALPDDLAQRVNDGGIDLAEAEAIQRERHQRIAALAERVQEALRVLTRMAGNPIPADLAEHLTDPEMAALPAVLSALEGGINGP